MEENNKNITLNCENASEENFVGFLKEVLNITSINTMLVFNKTFKLFLNEIIETNIKEKAAELDDAQNHKQIFEEIVVGNRKNPY